MNRFPKMAAPGVFLACVILVLAGCHKNESTQSAQNTAQSPATPDAQSQSATQPGTPNTAAPAPASASNAAPTASSAPAATPGPATSASGVNGSATPAPSANAQADIVPQPAPVVVPKGAVLRMRINQHINVKNAHAGDVFDGTIVQPVTVDGTEVIPAGSMARGQIVEAKRRGHFKGSSVLELTLTGLDVNGRHYRLDTSTIVRTKKGKGKRTAAFIGGGTGLGMLIGGVATGGVGLLVGGLAGAGAGTAGAAFTGNRDIDIPAETVMSFRLAQAIQLR